MHDLRLELLDRHQVAVRRTRLEDLPVCAPPQRFDHLVTLGELLLRDSDKLLAVSVVKEHTLLLILRYLILALILAQSSKLYFYNKYTTNSPLEKCSFDMKIELPVVFGKC